MTHKTLSAPLTWQGTTYKGLHTSSDGSFSLYESLCPASSGPPRHVHDREDETFYILSGTVDFWMDNQRSTKGAGDVMHVPRGTEHTFRVGDDGPARMLTVLTPGGFEGFFVAMAEGNCRIPEDMPTIARIAADYHLRFTGPPL